MTMRPTIRRSGLLGARRPDPHGVRWSAVDLARRRSLVIARGELEAAEARGDPAAVVDAWRQLVGTLAMAELPRLPASEQAAALAASMVTRRLR